MLTALLPTTTPPPIREATPCVLVTGRQPTVKRAAVRQALPLAIVAVATLAGMIAIVGTEQLGSVLSGSDAQLLTGAVVLQALALLCFTNLYRSTHDVVTGTDAPPTRSGAGSVGLAAFGLTQALPGGGVAGGALALRRFQQLGSCTVTAASTVIHIGLLSMGGLCLVVTVAIASTAVTTGQHTGTALAGLLACGALLGAFTLARRTGLYERAQRLVLGQVERLAARRTDAGRERLLHMAPTTSAQLLRGQALLGPLGWSVSKWALDLAVLTLVVRAVGGTASLAAIAGAYAAVNLLNSVPLTPGGLGVVEGGLSASLLAAGLDLGTAAAATLAYRAVSYWLPLAASVPAALHHLAAARGPALTGVAADPDQVAQADEMTVVTSDPGTRASCAVA